jgi:hypothetical protein
MPDFPGPKSELAVQRETLALKRSLSRPAQRATVGTERTAGAPPRAAGLRDCDAARRRAGPAASESHRMAASPPPGAEAAEAGPPAGPYWACAKAGLPQCGCCDRPPGSPLNFECHCVYVVCKYPRCEVGAAADIRAWSLPPCPVGRAAPAIAGGRCPGPRPVFLGTVIGIIFKVRASYCGSISNQEDNQERFYFCS